MHNIPEYIKLSFLPQGKNTILLDKEITIKGFSGQPISKIVRYCINEKKVYQYVDVNNEKVLIGQIAPSAYFFNQDKLGKYQNEQVIIFEEPGVAIEIQERLGEPANKVPGFIITTYLGNDISILPWDFLYGHNLIFVPKPGSKNLAMVKCWYQYSIDYRMASFKVARKFLMQGTRKVFGENDLITLTAAEKWIYDNCEWLDEIDYPQITLQNLVKTAMPFNDFEKLWQKLGVFKGEESSEHETKISISPSIPQEMTPAKAFRLEDITLFHIVRAGTPVMLVGMKNAGKTQNTYILAGGFLGQPNLPWPFNKNSTSSTPGNVCIVDGETPYDELMENLSQHGLKAELEKRLFVFTATGGNNPDWFERHMINDEKYREELFNFLVKNKCRLLILDNMKALMGSRVAHPDAVQKIFDWIDQLCKAGICVVYVLHKDEEAPTTSLDKNKGASTFRERARCIINIQGKNEILENQQWPNKVQEFVKQDGLLCGLHFPSCKSASQLENRIIWLRLPLGSGVWQTICVTDTDGNELDMSQICVHSENTAINADSSEALSQNTSSEVSAIPSDLSSGAQEIYALMKTFPNMECPIGDLVCKFDGKKGMGRDTIRDKYLAELIDKMYVEPIGVNDRDRKYKVKNA